MNLRNKNVEKQKQSISNDDQILSSGENIPSVLKKVDKWGAIENMGDPVGPTKFVPMKTPFSKQIIEAIIDQNDSDSKQLRKDLNVLTVDWMLKENLKQGREVGMIIDLSDHQCLYKQDIPAEVEYYEERLVAKQFPDEESVRRVHHVANDFWLRCPDKFIAIHCAYGFNRTGFVLCTYMIHMLHMSVTQAIECFKTARQPGIKHEKFINELHNRYDYTFVTSSEGEASASSTSSKMDVDIIYCNFYQNQQLLKEYNSSFAPFEMVPIGGLNRLKDSNSEIDNESLGLEQKEVLTAFSRGCQFSKLRSDSGVQSPCSNSFNSNVTISSTFRKRMWDSVFVKNYPCKEFSNFRINSNVKKHQKAQKGKFLRFINRIKKFFGQQPA